ncbi:MAG: nucleotidyltransferase [Polyangia bacterium]
MAIPESQLETWSHQGSIQQSSATYNAIKRILEAAETPYASRSYRVFLQGSYGNDTNIWAESDVDVVIRLDDCFSSDVSVLSELKKSAYSQAFADATYSYADFKGDVVKVLTDQYGDDVTVGDKAIAIAPRGGRRKADVIVSTQFRRYLDFNGIAQQRYIDGICFWNGSNERIANYPIRHSESLTKRHQAGGKWLKPLIRIFKNLRSRCVDDKLLGAGLAPSYYLEGLLYNVPVDKLLSTYQDCFVNAFNWIQTEADKDKLVCAHEQYYLLRDGLHTCWQKANAEAFLKAASELWKNW